MTPDSKIHHAIKAIHMSPSESLDQQVHQAIHQSPPPYRQLWKKMSIAAALVIVFSLILTPRTVVWADIVEHFASVNFVKTSLYVTEDFYRQPIHFDMWLSKGGYIKISTGAVTVLSEPNQPIRAYDHLQKSAVEPSNLVKDIIESIQMQDGFSLNTIIQAITFGNIQDITPSQSDHALLSKDMILFEGPSSINQGTVTITALRESKLPVSFRAYNRKDGNCFEAMISYPKQPDSDFFTLPNPK